MTKIIKEAIAEANAVQAVAEERAKQMLIKEFSPRIQTALASLISEEGVSTGSDQPGGYNPETDQDAVGATAKGQSSEDMSDKGDGPEKLKEEDELPVEDEPVQETEDADADDEPVLEADDDPEDEVPPIEEEAPEVPGMEDDVLEIVDEPASDSEIPPAPLGDEEEVPAKDAGMYEALRKRHNAVVRENKQLREAVSTLANKFKKIDLFNAKLAYAFKLMTQPGLSRNQKRQIAETFDAARSVREAQLIYKTLKTRVVPVAPKKVTPLQNKNVRSVLSESTQQSNGYGRMNELAGIK